MNGKSSSSKEQNNPRAVNDTDQVRVENGKRVLLKNEHPKSYWMSWFSIITFTIVESFGGYFWLQSLIPHFFAFAGLAIPPAIPLNIVCIILCLVVFGLCNYGISNANIKESVEFFNLIPKLITKARKAIKKAFSSSNDDDLVIYYNIFTTDHLEEIINLLSEDIQISSEIKRKILKNLSPFANLNSKEFNELNTWFKDLRLEKSELELELESELESIKIITNNDYRKEIINYLKNNYDNFHLIENRILNQNQSNERLLHKLNTFSSNEPVDGTMIFYKKEIDKISEHIDDLEASSITPETIKNTDDTIKGIDWNNISQIGCHNTTNKPLKHNPSTCVDFDEYPNSPTTKNDENNNFNQTPIEHNDEILSKQEIEKITRLKDPTKIIKNTHQWNYLIKSENAQKFIKTRLIINELNIIEHKIVRIASYLKEQSQNNLPNDENDEAVDVNKVAKDLIEEIQHIADINNKDSVANFFRVKLDPNLLFLLKKNKNRNKFSNIIYLSKAELSSIEQKISKKLYDRLSDNLSKTNDDDNIKLTNILKRKEIKEISEKLQESNSTDFKKKVKQEEKKEAIKLIEDLQQDVSNIRLSLEKEIDSEEFYLNYADSCLKKYYLFSQDNIPYLFAAICMPAWILPYLVINLLSKLTKTTNKSFKQFIHPNENKYNTVFRCYLSLISLITFPIWGIIYLIARVTGKNNAEQYTEMPKINNCFATAVTILLQSINHGISLNNKAFGIITCIVSAEIIISSLISGTAITTTAATTAGFLLNPIGVVIFIALLLVAIFPFIVKNSVKLPEVCSQIRLNLGYEESKLTKELRAVRKLEKSLRHIDTSIKHKKSDREVNNLKKTKRELEKNNSELQDQNTELKQSESKLQNEKNVIEKFALQQEEELTQRNALNLAESEEFFEIKLHYTLSLLNLNREKSNALNSEALRQRQEVEKSIKNIRENVSNTSSNRRSPHINPLETNNNNKFSTLNV